MIVFTILCAIWFTDGSTTTTKQTKTVTQSSGLGGTSYKITKTSAGKRPYRPPATPRHPGYITSHTIPPVTVQSVNTAIYHKEQNQHHYALEQFASSCVLISSRYYLHLYFWFYYDHVCISCTIRICKLLSHCVLVCEDVPYYSPVATVL